MEVKQYLDEALEDTWVKQVLPTSLFYSSHTLTTAAHDVQ